ncbi:hypothetical protein XZ90_004857 [Salmonella enterica subsp. enterica]|nr:hypothetical protein [Salmonella enterica subsp. enterica serovar Litchfield]
MPTRSVPALTSAGNGGGSGRLVRAAGVRQNLATTTTASSRKRSNMTGSISASL